MFCIFRKVFSVVSGCSNSFSMSVISYENSRNFAVVKTAEDIQETFFYPNANAVLQQNSAGGERNQCWFCSGD